MQLLSAVHFSDVTTNPGTVPTIFDMQITFHRVFKNPYQLSLVYLPPFFIQ